MIRTDAVGGAIPAADAMACALATTGPGAGAVTSGAGSDAAGPTLVAATGALGSIPSQLLRKTTMAMPPTVTSSSMVMNAKSFCLAAGCFDTPSMTRP